MSEGVTKLGQAQNRTAHRLRAVALGKINKPGYHHDGEGLYLQVRAGRHGLTRSWIFRFMRSGKARMMGLGEFPLITLAKARAEAQEARKLLLEGIDPIDARDALRAAATVPAAPIVTLRQAAERYMDGQEPGWGSEHASQWRNSLRDYVFPLIGDRPVASIDTASVMQSLDPIWNSKTATANRVRNRIEKVLDWATARGYRQGENPAKWKGHLEHMLAPPGRVQKVVHYPAMPYAELPAFMAELRALDGTAARVLEFTILTAARSGEATGARWDEIDLDTKLWVVPADRMKSGKEHRVPLSDAALAILTVQQNESDFVFPGAWRASQPISQNTLFYLLRRMGRDVSVHGFRSSFTDWATECTTFTAEMRDLAIAHVVSDRVEAAYRRGDMFDRRREMMTAWARWCDGTAQDAANVVPLRA